MQGWGADLVDFSGWPSWCSFSPPPPVWLGKLPACLILSAVSLGVCCGSLLGFGVSLLLGGASIGITGTMGALNMPVSNTQTHRMKYYLALHSFIPVTIFSSPFVSLHSPAYSENHYVDQSDFKLKKIFLPLPFPVLRLKVLAITSGSLVCSLLTLTVSFECGFWLAGCCLADLWDLVLCQGLWVLALEFVFHVLLLLSP